MVHELNKDRTKMAYTFDAGPNCFLLLKENDLNKVKESILSYFEGKEVSFYEEKVELRIS